MGLWPLVTLSKCSSDELQGRSVGMADPWPARYPLITAKATKKDFKHNFNSQVKPSPRFFSRFCISKAGHNMFLGFQVFPYICGQAIRTSCALHLIFGVIGPDG